MEHAPTPQPHCPQIDPQMLASLQPAASETMPDTTSARNASMNRRVLLGFAGLAGVAALAKLAQAGPLEPPPGPISPTGATLTELRAKASEATIQLGAISNKVAFTDQGVSEPRTPITACPPSADAQFVITQPGAYYLTSNLQQVQGRVCIDIQCSDVDLDCQGFAFIGSGNAAGPPSTCIRASGQSNLEVYDCSFVGWTGDCCGLADCNDCCVSDCIFRNCTCPSGFSSTGTVVEGALIRCGNGACIDDCTITSCVGRLLCHESAHVLQVAARDSFGNIRCGSGACIESCSVHSCQSSGGAPGSPPDAFIQCGDNSCITECDVRACTGLAISAGLSCVIECCEVTGGSGGAISCESACCVEDCTVSNHQGLAIRCADGSCVTECDCRNVSGGLGAVVTAGANSVIECCEVTGGSSTLGAYLCASGVCVDDCTAMSHNGLAIDCAEGCSLSDNKLRYCFGLRVTDDCTVCDNEVSNAPGGGAGAIMVMGQRCCVSGNYVGNGGIIIFAGGDYALIEDNHCVGAGGPPGTGGGTIALAQGVTGCTVRDNHIRRPSTTNAFVIPAGNSYGPIANCIAGGDLSILPSGSHPHANFVY